MIVRLTKPKAPGAAIPCRPRGARGTARLTPLPPDEEVSMPVLTPREEEYTCHEEEEGTSVADGILCFDPEDSRSVAGSWVAEPTFMHRLLPRCLQPHPSLSSRSSSTCSTSSSCSTISTTSDQSRVKSEALERQYQHSCGSLQRSTTWSEELDHGLGASKQVNFIALPMPLLQKESVKHSNRSPRSRKLRLCRSARSSRESCSWSVSNTWPRPPVEAEEEEERGLGRCHPPAFGSGYLPEGVGVELQLCARDASPPPRPCRRAVSGSFTDRVAVEREVAFKTFCLPALELARQSTPKLGDRSPYSAEKRKWALSHGTSWNH